MGFLTAQERQTIVLLCDTLVPALEAAPDAPPAHARLLRTRASDLDIASAIEVALEQAVPPPDLQKLRVFFRAIELAAVNGLTVGVWKPFGAMTLDERTRLLWHWANSPLELQRRAFNGVKRLALFLFYSAVPPEVPNPLYPVVGYELPPREPDGLPRPIRPLSITTDTTLTCDVLVVGSGAGGGVMAGELAAAGLDVIVAEKGGYFHDTDFHGREQESTQTMFERYGALATSDTAMVVLSGSVLGGGTVVNWMTSLRPPAHVLHEWARDYGFAGAESQALQDSLDAVSARLNINTEESRVNPNNAALERGCRALGYEVTTIPRNVRGCEACDTCGFGCPFGAKQSTLKTYLQDAYDHGARIVVRAEVERVTHQAGVVTGAEMTVQDVNGQMHRVTVRARRVVLAASTIHTPAILLRSGINNPNIGLNLRLHPTTVVAGRHAEDILPWAGAPQTRASFQYANLDGQGYGVWLETAPAHPGLFALAFAWRDGAEHKRVMQSVRHQANIIILTRDRGSGRVRLGPRGMPMLDYRVSDIDRRHMMQGIVAALRVQHAAGAHEITAPHNAYLMWRRDGPEAFEAFLERVKRAGLPAGGYGLFSAHQMGTARIHGSAQHGVVKPDGESWNVRGLYVADGSLFPTSLGVNPMVTISALAHYVSHSVKAGIGVKD